MPHAVHVHQSSSTEFRSQAKADWPKLCLCAQHVLRQLSYHIGLAPKSRLGYMDKQKQLSKYMTDPLGQAKLTSISWDINKWQLDKQETALASVRYKCTHRKYTRCKTKITHEDLTKTLAVPLNRAHGDHARPPLHQLYSGLWINCWNSGSLTSFCTCFCAAATCLEVIPVNSRGRCIYCAHSTWECKWWVRAAVQGQIVLQNISKTLLSS